MTTFVHFPRARHLVVACIAPTLLLLVAQDGYAAVVNGLNASYYSGTTPGGIPLLTRTDASVNFNWTDTSPHASIPTDRFSARWTGKITPTTTENYTISVRADDGVRLWLNNALVIDRWNDTAARTDSVTIACVEGTPFSAVLEYYENTGSAEVKLSWSTPTIPDTTIPATALTPGAIQVTPPAGKGTGILGQYFPKVDLSGTATVRIDNNINFDWQQGAPISGYSNDQYSVRWLGTVTPTVSDTYRFVASTDDGVRLWLDDVLIIDTWIDRAVGSSTSAPIAFKKGKARKLRMEFYENAGSASASLSWFGTTVMQQVVPKDVLLPARAPIALFASATISQDTSASGTLRGNDPDGDKPTFALVVAPVNGTVEIDPVSGGWSYKPTSGFVGTDAFSFVAKDAFLTSTPAKVTVSVKSSASWVDNKLSGLVAWWRFNDGSGKAATDSTGNKHTASVDSAHSVWRTTSDRGALLQQTGSGGPETPDAVLLRPSGPFTLSAWIRPDHLLSEMNGNWPSVINKHDWNANAGYLLGRIEPQGNQLGFRILDSSAVAGTFDVSYEETSVKSWIHLAAQYDGNAMRIFRNGTLMAERIVGQLSLPGSNKYLQMGSDGFSGLIDDVRVYRTALSVTDIAALSAKTPANAIPVVTVEAIGSIAPNLTGNAIVHAFDPEGGALTCRWSAVGGSTGIRFADNRAASTTVTFPGVGSKSLRVAVSDGTSTVNIDTVAQVYNRTDLTSGMVAFYDFANWNGGDVIPDESGLGHGALWNTAVPGPGYRGKGVVLTGAGTLATPDAPDLRLQRYTFSLWMKPTVTIGSMADSNPALVMKQNYSGNSGFWFGSAGDHTDALILRSFTGNSLVEMRELRIAEPTATTWVHMVGRNDGQKMSIWRNGMLQAASVAGAVATLNHDDTWLYFGYRFQGVLDDIRIYDRAISDTEIKALASDLSASSD